MATPGLSRHTTGKPRGGKRSTSFKPGQSGNPAGGKKPTAETLDLVAACKARTPAALAVIEKIMLEGENERNRLAAATAIIDRAYGRPTQTIAGDASAPLHVVGTVRLIRAA